MHRSLIVRPLGLLLLVVTLAMGGLLSHRRADAAVVPSVASADVATLLTRPDGPSTLDVGRLRVGSVVLQRARVSISGAGARRRARIQGGLTWGRSQVAVTGSTSRSTKGVASSLGLRKTLAMGPGVRLEAGTVRVDGGTVSLAGRVGLLGSPFTTAGSGPVRLGATPAYDLRTASGTRLALADDPRVGFVGASRVRSSATGASRVTGTSTLGTLPVNGAELDITVDGDHLALRLRGSGQLGQGVKAEIDGQVSVSARAVTVQFRGLVSLLDRFTDVGATGMVSASADGTTRYDLTTASASALDLNGSKDLFLRGGLRLHGIVGQPVGIDAQLRALGNDVRLTGTLTGDPGGGRLHLTEAAGSTSTALVDLEVSRHGVRGQIRLDWARLDSYTVSDLALDVTVDVTGNLSVGVSATVDLLSGRVGLAGVERATGTISGTFTSTPSSGSNFALQVRIQRLETTRGSVADTIGSLHLDYLDVSLSLPPGGRGRVPFSATLAAAGQPDGSFVLPPTRGADGGARIDVTGWLTFVDGRIQTWSTHAQVQRLHVGQFMISADLVGQGDARTGVADTQVSGDIVALGGRVTGHLEGPVGYSPQGGLRLGLHGWVDVVDASGLYAHLAATMTDHRTLAITGNMGFGGFGGEVTGTLGLRIAADGTAWPIVDLHLHGLHYSRLHTGKDGLNAWWDGEKAAALVDVTLDNRSVPTTFVLKAAAIGEVFPAVAPGFWDTRTLAYAGFGAQGWLSMVDGKPSYTLDVSGLGAGEVDLLGVFLLQADGTAHLRLRGDADRVVADASGVVLPRVHLAGFPVGGGAGVVDVHFEGAPAAQRYAFSGSAAAGAHLLGPLITAGGHLEFDGTADLGTKRATVNVGGSGRAQAFAVLARGSASGWLSVNVDFASAEPFVTGVGHLTYGARFLMLQVAGLDADLRFDGTTLWVAGGTKVLNEAALDCGAFAKWAKSPSIDPRDLLDEAGSAIVCVASAVRTTVRVLLPFVFPAHRVVDLRGTLYPTENLCGSRERSGPFTLWNWVADGSYGDCGAGLTSARGRVLADTDGSRSATAGDVGIAGITVRVANAAGVQVGPDLVTSDSGTWQLSGLVAGEVYVVTAEVPSGQVVVAAPDGGTDASVAFSAERGSLVEVGSLVVGQPNEVTGTPGSEPGILTGSVVEDIDGDGSPVGDQGFADVLVHVAGPLTTTVRTDANGRWVVRNAPPGAYTVEVVRPTYHPTIDPDGTLDGITTATVAPAGITAVGPFGLQADQPPSADPSTEPSTGGAPAPDDVPAP